MTEASCDNIEAKETICKGLGAFKKLFLPNCTPKQAVEIDSNKQSIVGRILKGEEVRLGELGVREYILKSGRVSGKTQHDELAAILDLINDELGDMWYVRSEEGDIRRSIFASTLNTITMLGLTYSNGADADFRVSRSPFEITHNATGNRIQYFAINKDINRSKGMQPPSGKLKRVMVEEANEVDDGMYIDALVTTAVRYFNAQSKLIFRLNPPMTKQHWSLSYFEKRKNAGATVIYTTWIQLAKIGLLNPATVSEILKMKQSDSKFYDYWYLGNISNLQGLVFPAFSRSKHIVNVDEQSLPIAVVDIIIAGDAANKNDQTAFAVLLVLRDGRILVLDMFYYDPIKEGQQTDDVELAKLICDWYNKLVIKYPFITTKRKRGIVDNANWNLMMMLQKSIVMGGFKWYPATDKSIARDTQRLRTLIREDMILINQNEKKTMCLVEEIEGYIFDPKSGEIKKNQKDHAIDMLKYGTLMYSDTSTFF